ncbi:hypothetical protein Vretifemale_1180 [Volvox reticuliferus]|uniref:Uncharacterized protein n=1 Tax=Volvox reticuliferus TaxID=1737510 RepID=A0A8J4BY37_9CHLO|nr:hypothetical protein Vretifemale_1180 [Volvox reticuliferus]
MIKGLALDLAAQAPGARARSTLAQYKEPWRDFIEWAALLQIQAQDIYDIRPEIVAMYLMYVFQSAKMEEASAVATGTGGGGGGAGCTAGGRGGIPGVTAVAAVPPAMDVRRELPPLGVMAGSEGRTRPKLLWRLGADGDACDANPTSCNGAAISPMRPHGCHSVEPDPAAAVAATATLPGSGTVPGCLARNSSGASSSPSSSSRCCASCRETWRASMAACGASGGAAANAASSACSARSTRRASSLQTTRAGLARARSGR